ncbi:hypothetical protein P4544_03020 [Halomonas sp. LY9]
MPSACQPGAYHATQWALLLLVCSLLVGCTHPVVREHQTALGIADARQTWLGNQVAVAAAEQTDPDGFALLANGREAFAVRVGLIRQAQRELISRPTCWAMGKRLG